VLCSCAAEPGNRILPCQDGSGCLPGHEGKGFLYSALHDPTLNEVAIFADLLTQDKEFDVHCAFWKGNFTSGDGLHLEAVVDTILDANLKYAPYMIRCPDPLPVMKELPMWVAVLVNGEDIGARIRVEQVDLYRRGTLGACVAVIHSDKMQQTYEWLKHHTMLGVEGFDIYWTNSSVKPESDSVDDPASSFSYPGVRWVQYKHLPLEERFYYSQQTVYNECVYYNRHKYEYLMMFDVDEFVILKDRRYQGERAMQAWLRHTFPAHQTALGLYRYAYRDDCREEGEPTEHARYLDRFTHRMEEPESQSVLQSKRFADKLIVKPLGVSLFYMHFLQASRDGWEAETLNTQPSLAFLKHIRSHGHDCEELVTEDPFDQ